MIFLRKADDRGHANHGWLDSWHTFSFADYYDPDFMGFQLCESLMKMLSMLVRVLVLTRIKIWKS